MTDGVNDSLLLEQRDIAIKYISFRHHDVFPQTRQDDVDNDEQNSCITDESALSSSKFERTFLPNS